MRNQEDYCIQRMLFHAPVDALRGQLDAGQAQICGSGASGGSALANTAGAAPVGEPGALLAIEPAKWGKATPSAHFATKSASCCLDHSVMIARPSFWPNRDGEDTMRAYFTATGMALGLLVVWAALVPFVA